VRQGVSPTATEAIPSCRSQAPEISVNILGDETTIGWTDLYGDESVTEVQHGKGSSLQRHWHRL
jgi:hypothetical protein